MSKDCRQHVTAIVCVLREASFPGGQFCAEGFPDGFARSLGFLFFQSPRQHPGGDIALCPTGNKQGGQRDNQEGSKVNWPPEPSRCSLFRSPLLRTDGRVSPHQVIARKAVPKDASLSRIQACLEAGSSRTTDRLTRACQGEVRATLSDPVECRRQAKRIAMHSGSIPPLLVGEEHDHIGLISMFAHDLSSWDSSDAPAGERLPTLGERLPTEPSADCRPARSGDLRYQGAEVGRPSLSVPDVG